VPTLGPDPLSLAMSLAVVARAVARMVVIARATRVMAMMVVGKQLQQGNGKDVGNGKGDEAEG
jgi:hypothetical protein